MKNSIDWLGVRNVVDRRSNCIYDRVKIKAGMFLPERLVRFNYPVYTLDPLWGAALLSEVKTYADTNMLASQCLPVPYDLTLRRILFLFQPSCSQRDRNALLARYYWEFEILEKLIIRQPGAVGSAEADITNVVENFGKGSQFNPEGPRVYDPISHIDALAPGVCWDLDKDNLQYIPPLVNFRMTMNLAGLSFQLETDLDLYICLEGLTDFPVQ